MVSTVPGLRGLLNGLAHPIEGAASSFLVGMGDVGGLLCGELRAGDDVKKLGGLEIGAGDDGRGSGGTETSSDQSIQQSSTKPGELGGKGDIGRAKVADTGSLKGDRFCCSFERSSAHKAEVSWPGDGVSRI